MKTSTDRRTMLRGLGALTAGAAAAVAAIPAVAAAETPDPVFARIEALNAATAHLDDIRGNGDRVAYEEACRAEGAAFDELTETPPVTIPGMRVLLEFLDEWCGGNNGDYFDYSLLLRSPLLVGWAQLSSAEQEGRLSGRPFRLPCDGHHGVSCGVVLDRFSVVPPTRGANFAPRNPTRRGAFCLVCWRCDGAHGNRRLLLLRLVRS